MARLTNGGRAALAAAVLDKQDTLFLAWGSGLAGWDTVPESPGDDIVALVNELGRARLAVAAFVVPDVAGVVLTPSGSYTVSEAPTTNLYLKFDYGFDFPAGLTIREVGLFIDASVNPAVPLGQLYLPLTDVVAAGHLMATERFLPVAVDPAVGQVFQFILPF